MSIVHDLALETECGYCGAEAEQWCVTSSGARASWLHGDRTKLIQDAFSAGYCEGQANAYEESASWFQKRREGYRWAMDAPLAGLDVIGWLSDRADTWNRHAKAAS